MKNVAYTMRDKCFGAFVHSASEKVQQFWSSFVPKSYIYSEDDLSRLQAVFSAQKKLVTALKKLVKRKILTLDEAKRRGHLILILDDLMYLGKKIFSDPLIKEIWCNGRHSWCTVFISLQYSKGIDPMLRLQIDWSFIWKVSKPNEKKKILEEWVGYFKDFRTFDCVFEKLTGNFSCLCVRSSPGGSNAIEQNVFHWKPDVLSNFKLGDPPYQEFHRLLVKEKKRHRIQDVQESRKRLKVI